MFPVTVILAVCVSWACGTLYSKYRASAEEEVNGFAGSAWQMLWASLVFALCSVFTGSFSHFRVSEVSLTSWLSLACIVSFGSLMAYSSYVWLLKVRPAAGVATHAYVNPVVSVILGVGLGHEHVSALQALGLAVILVGVTLFNAKKGKGTAGGKTKLMSWLFAKCSHNSKDYK